VTTRISFSAGGAQGDNNSYVNAVSADGRYIAFMSDASTLVAGDTNGRRDIFVRDRLTGTTVRVSVDSAGTEASWRSDNASISADGCYVTFESQADTLVPGDTNHIDDIFVHDLQTGVTEPRGGIPAA
jgi:Tol biopolymer transport system component